MKLLVPVSYFFNTPRSEIWELDTLTGDKNRLCSLPSGHRDVRGKGITGIARLDSERVVVCDFNQLLILNTLTWEIVGEYTDSELNDLHQVSVCEDHIYLANTGRDCIDVFDYNLEHKKRIDGLTSEEWAKRNAGAYSISSSYYDSPADGLPFHCRRVPDKWHFNHVFKSPASLDAKVIATCFSTRTMMDAETLESISNVLPEQPHDGYLADDLLWVTTVSGKVYRAPLSIPLKFELFCDLFQQAPHQGWCRGLHVEEKKFFVGITAIYEKSNRTSWLHGSIEETRSGIYQLCKETLKIEAFHDFSSENGSRIFSLISA